jgi:hypothetical protein
MPKLSNGTTNGWRRYSAISDSKLPVVATRITITLSLVETVADLEGLFVPVAVEAPVREVVAIDYNGIKRLVRIVDARGRVVAENQVADDGWSSRGTFAGDTEAFLAAKRAGVGLKPDPGRAATGATYPATADYPG